MPQVIVQKWEESERGWGVRPDGYSIHPNEKARARFIAAYWAKMPDAVPDEYSRPSGTPYIIDVPDDVAKKIKGDGDRFYSNNYPGGGGKDGWVNAGNSK